MSASDATYFPGLEGVIAGETAISTIEGGLQYRGYPIEYLAENHDFEDVAYLILHGELPSDEARELFHQRVRRAAVLPDVLLSETLLPLFQQIPAAVPLMDVLRTATSLLGHWDPDLLDNHPDASLRKAERLLGQLPVALAAAYRIRHGETPIPAREDLPFADNLLWMLTGQEPSEDQVSAMDVSLILYAEHEFNASTFTARVIASTLSDLHSAITGAIGALKGPLHGGANERVLEVLQEVGDPQQAQRWVEQALNEKRRIMGFGHRVYKTGDPRAKFLESYCQKLATSDEHRSMQQTAEVIERVVVQQKGLPPNLDWPSARLYHFLGLPVELYTPLFVVSRVTGWGAHVVEQQQHNRLIRPRSRYVGPVRS